MTSFGSFRRLDSLEEDELFGSGNINSSNQIPNSSYPNDQLIVQTQPAAIPSRPQVPPLNIETRRRSISHQYEENSYVLSSSFIPPTSTTASSYVLPSSITMISPLKDISKSKKLFSPTENILPMTIGSKSSNIQFYLFIY